MGYVYSDAPAEDGPNETIRLYVRQEIGMVTSDKHGINSMVVEAYLQASKYLDELASGYDGGRQGLYAKVEFDYRGVTFTANATVEAS